MEDTNKLLCLKNVGAQISMFFTSNEKSAPMEIGRIKILIGLKNGTRKYFENGLKSMQIFQKLMGGMNRR